MSQPTRVLLLLAATSLAACATTAPAPARKPQSGLEGAVTQPLSDLSLRREEGPPLLAAAAAAPYALPDGFDCAGAAAAVSALDAVLGPDVDLTPAKTGSGAGALLIDALKGVTALPYRGLIRKMSGAETRDRLRAQAVLAGMVRRGHLKGWMRGQGCPSPAP